MAKRGRPRKYKEREPSGRGSRAATKRENEAFARWQRRYLLGSVPVEKLLDPKNESPLGQLFMSEQIDKSQYENGESYYRIVRRYRRVRGLPVEFPARGGGGVRRGVDHRDYSAEVVKAATERYLDARRKIARAGPHAVHAVHELVVEYRRQYGDNLELAKKGLTMMSWVYKANAFRKPRPTQPKDFAEDLVEPEAEPVA